MPKFAAFDPSAPQPAPVVGWYDTDKHAYKNLPPDGHLLELSDEQWAARLTTPFIDKGMLVAAPAETEEQKKAAALKTLQSQARRALADSADVVLEKLEAGEPAPKPWIEYRAALRAIITGANSGATQLPAAPTA